MTPPSTDERLALVEADVEVLQPHLPRFGLAAAQRAEEGVVARIRADKSRVISFSTQDLISRNLTDLPTSGVLNGGRAWAADGRKPSEGAGTGTGVPVYFDEVLATWLSYRTDVEVLV